jgi:predicted transposase YdaD
LSNGVFSKTNDQVVLASLLTGWRLGGTARTDALAKLVILAGLKRLHPVVREEIQQMPITINIQENPFLREIFEEGRQEGRQEEAAVLLRRLLERRFGPLPPWAQQQLAAADIASLETWGLRLLEATSLEEVLRTA